MSDLLRFGQASADLDERPERHDEWAETTDRAIRRALMRSPRLTPAVAERIVETRRSGMHTLGSNPLTPDALLDSNPGARRRRERVLDAAPGGLDEVTAHPNRRRYVEAGSPTLDLVLARARGLRPATARALAGRRHPPPDPWVLAILVARFGADVDEILDRAASAQRRRAVAVLVDRAAGTADQTR